jgi:phage terminase large subunit-like protein
MIIPENQSPLRVLASQSREEQEAMLAGLSRKQKRALLYKWRNWQARPNQLAPEGNWRVWLIMAGRGFGKTRSGAEWVREQAESGRFRHIALVAETAGDARKVMIEGESGILAISPPDFRPIYEPSKRQLRWPNGAVATAYSGDEPDQLRGPQHDAAWADEPAKWKRPQPAWDNLELGVRIGPDPRIVATTTPRSIPWLRKLVKERSTVVTHGSTYDNVQNLAPSFIAHVIDKYAGTRLGRQELHAELFEDVQGALWTREQLEALRVTRIPCGLLRIVVAIDPAVTASEDANETGIIVAGIGEDGHGYLLADYSGRWSLDGWAQQAVKAYREYGADRIVGEANNGGDLIGRMLCIVDPYVPYRSVHASRGKYLRAEPVAALYERKCMHHVGHPKLFTDLEDQMCSFVQGDSKSSPDRLDAAVWAFTELFFEPQEPQSGTLVYYDPVRIGRI